MPALPTRQPKGHTTIELAAMCFFLVILVLLSVDVGVVALGSSLNERASRDAARAAAQADNYGTALNMAQTAILPHQGDGYFVTSPIIDVPSFVYQDWGGNPPPNTSPYVSVTTNSTVRIPAPVFFFGASFGTQGTMNCSKTYTFPIVKTKLYLN